MVVFWISKNDSIGKNKSTLEDLKDLYYQILLLLICNILTHQERVDFKDKYGVDILKLEEIDNFNDIDGLASLIDAVISSQCKQHDGTYRSSIGKETCLMLPKGKEGYGIGQKRIN